MSFMTWSHHFETGLDGVDKQHKALVDLVNAVAPLLSATGDAGVKQAEHLLDQLTHYATVHFQDEEALMRDTGLAPEYIDKHGHTHEAFGHAVVTMRRQATQAGQLTGNELLRFLTSWLTFHILGEDQAMARQIKAMQGGDTAQAAWATEAARTDASAPTAVYTTALIDLFSVVTQRNRALHTLNEQLQAAQTKLSDINRELEARVAERTEALTHANLRLTAEQAALVASMAELKQTQARLLQAEKMAAVGQLAAGVAHEINNPIGFVTSNLNTLNTYTTQMFELIDAHGSAVRPSNANSTVNLNYLKEDVPALIAESAAGLQRVKNIVANLLAHNQLDTKSWQPVAWNDLVSRALQATQDQRPPRIALTLALGDVPMVLCSVDQVRQVLMNLLRNAAQAIEGTGTIHVRSGQFSAAGKVWAWIEVTDSGTGMTEDVKHRVFDPFFTTRPVGQGVGLGLSVVWDVVQQHSGRVSVNSQPGKGATFRVELPCTQVTV